MTKLSDLMGFSSGFIYTMDIFRNFALITCQMKMITGKWKQSACNLELAI